MFIRSLAALRHDQAAILDDYRATLRGAPGAPSSGGDLELAPIVEENAASPRVLIGRIVGVAEKHDALGEAVLVRLVRWTGSPPTPEAVGSTVMACLPVPGARLEDYHEDEYVRLLPAPGVVLAQRLT